MSSTKRTPQQTYLESGFYVHPTPVLPALALQKALDRIPAIINEEYDTGIAPMRRWNMGDSQKIQKIDHVHLCDKAFHLLATQPILGKWVADVTGAEMVQLWSTQLLIKPPGGENLGVIGWHTDRLHWPQWEGEVLTLWLALCDVDEKSGPVLYVEGSHRWVHRTHDVDDAFTQDLAYVENKLKGEDPAQPWTKIPAILPKGGVAFHNADTLHASAANTSNHPRIGLALNLRTERSHIKPGYHDFDFASYLSQPFVCPVVYQRPGYVMPPTANSNTRGE